MSQYIKYPRTSHLPWSESATSDDVWTGIDFTNKEVVITEKMDGECTTLYADHLHARSVSSGHHPSRSWVKQLHASIRHDIPEGWRVCGENMFAYHSILYFDLPSYFMCFGIYNEDNFCLSWDETVEFCSLLGLETVPVLYRGIFDLDKFVWEGKGYFTTMESDVSEPRSIDDFKPSVAEGYVVRASEGFHYNNFQEHVAKYVRKNHVKQNAGHWASKPVVPNVLVGEKLSFPTI